MADELVGVKTPDVDEADRKADEEADAVLERITGDAAASAKEGDEPTEGLSRQRDDRGRFVESDQPEASDSPPQDVDQDEYRRATRALKLDKVPEKILKNMTPQEIVQWGLARAKNHSDVDRIKARAAELEKAAASKTPEAAQAQSGLDEEVKAFSELFGDEAGEVLKRIMDKVSAPKQDADMTDKLARLEQSLRRQEQMSARQGLATYWKRFGIQLTDPDAWEKVLEYRSEDTREYPSEAEALKVACRMLFSDEALESQVLKLRDSHEARSNGQPTTEGRQTGKPTSANDVGELEDEILDAIQDGDEKKVRSIARKLGRGGHISNTELLASKGQ